MNCEDRLMSLEEYVDGELDEQAARRVSSHVAVCKWCASSCEALRREQGAFALYRSEVDLDLPSWTAVRARIDQETINSARNSRARLQGWLAGVLKVPLAGPALTTALALILIGVVAGSVKFLNSTDDTAPERARVHSGNGNGADTSGSQVSSEPGKAATDHHPGMVVSNPATASKASNNTGANEHRSLPKALEARLERSRRQTRLKAEPKARSMEGLLTAPAPGVESASTAARNANYDPLSDTATVERQLTNDAGANTARHVEQAQTVLRSFRNARPGAKGFNPDIAYEKQRSQKLLYRNIVLRREAASDGNLPVEMLLNSLEPILIDIANLPDHPARDDVRSIRERVEKKKLIAMLQLSAASASHPY